MGKHFMHHNMNITTKVSKKELLDALVKNRENHTKIVTEARNGFLDKAQVALEARLEDLRKGRIITLSFSLQPPLDFTEAYDTAIQMVQMHQDPTIELDTQMFRCFVMDEWDWAEQFFAINKLYSGTANECANTKGY